jgi:hypothetical protein
MGTFVKLQTMADGTPRIVLEMQCGLTEIAALNLVPGAPFGLARLAPGAQPKQEEEKPKGGELARLAGIWCGQPTFWKWLGVAGEADATQAIYDRCRVSSRVDLDHDDHAAMRFQELIRLPYMAYMQGKAA